MTPIDNQHASDHSVKFNGGHNYGRPINAYRLDELADMYNRARVDYMVPMPMNSQRMSDYIKNYDIHLGASLVALDKKDHEVNGIGMLGVRGKRSWITRLGVIPDRRRRRVGQFLMEKLLEWSQTNGINLVQLEVIKGNESAYQLFSKLGFTVTRELLVIQRTPREIAEHERITNFHVESIDNNFDQWLDHAAPDPSWVEEKVSILNAGSLKGFKITLPSHEEGFIIFQQTPFHLTHLVTNADASMPMLETLISHVHQQYTTQDTRIENVPLDAPIWQAYQKYGYVESFRRLEMFLHLE